MTTARTVLAAILSLGVVAGCTAVADAPETATTRPASTPTVPPTTPTPEASLGAMPPEASLGVEGGDPVVGQLGSYVWAETGADAPWLPGAPLAVGAGETIVVTVAPAIPIAEWTARAAPADDLGAADPIPLGQGVVGSPAFAPPATGRWSIAVTIRFADDLGDATYYWDVDVR